MRCSVIAFILWEEFCVNQAILSILIIVAAMFSFALELVPLPITAMTAALAMGIFGIISFEDIYSGFASTSVMMVAGMIIIGNSIFASGLADYIGNKLTKTAVVRNERIFLFVMIIFSALLSAFLSNSAVVAMCIPLVGTIALKSSGKIQNKNIIMAVGMAAAMGGACTIAGSTAQLAAQQILETTDGCRPLGFFELSYVCAPLCLILALYFATFGYKIQKKTFLFQDVNVLGSVGQEAKEAKKAEDTPKLTRKMIFSGIAMLFCIISFISGIWNVAVIALVGATFCLLTGCLSFKNAMLTMDWNTIVILGAVQGFAKGLDKSGGGKLLAEAALNVLGGTDASPYLILITGIVISVILTNFMSNTAVLAMLTPMFINIGFQIGIRPEVFILGCIIGGSTALATPIGTPSVTQTLVAGYRFKDYIRVGLPITVILTIACCILCPIVYGFEPII